MTSQDGEREKLREALRRVEAELSAERVRNEDLARQLDDIRRETQHSVRNILAVVRSIARRSASSTESVEEYREYLDGRIGAFSRVQATIVRNPGAGVDLETLISDELVSFGIRLGEQVRIEGPRIRMRDKPAGLVGLAFHELVLNSINHGAVGDGGLVEVSWHRERGATGDLCIQWIDRGVGKGTGNLGTHKRGFGSQVLQEAIAYELSGSTLFDFTAEGMICRIRMPGDCIAA